MDTAIAQPGPGSEARLVEAMRIIPEDASAIAFEMDSDEAELALQKGLA